MPTFGWTSETIPRHDRGIRPLTSRPRSWTASVTRFRSQMVSWEQGDDCGSGDFCGNGTVVRARSSLNGYAYLDRETSSGEDPLWRPRHARRLDEEPPGRTTVADRIAEARKIRPLIGRVETSGSAVLSTDLPDIATAAAMTRQARLRAGPRRPSTLKAGSDLRTSPRLRPAAAPVFRAVRLDLGENEELVDVQVRILEDNQPTERLDGHEIMSDVPLAVEAVARFGANQGISRTNRSPIPSRCRSARAEAAPSGSAVPSATAFRYPPAPSPTGSEKFVELNLTTEPDGSPCCWYPTEAVIASVVAEVEVDDGDGGKVFVDQSPDSRQIGTATRGSVRSPALSRGSSGDQDALLRRRA